MSSKNSVRAWPRVVDSPLVQEENWSIWLSLRNDRVRKVGRMSSASRRRGYRTWGGQSKMNKYPFCQKYRYLCNHCSYLIETQGPFPYCREGRQRHPYEDLYQVIILPQWWHEICYSKRSHDLIFHDGLVTRERWKWENSLDSFDAMRYALCAMRFFK